MTTSKKTKPLNKTQLAKTLGISRRTVTVYLARPGAPQPTPEGLYAFAEVRAWAEQCAEDARAGNAAVGDPAYKALRRRRMLLEVRQLERQAAVEERKLVPVAQIAPTIAAFNAALTADLQQVFEVEMPPRCRGKDVVEIRVMMAEGVDRVLRKLKTGQWALGLPE